MQFGSNIYIFFNYVDVLAVFGTTGRGDVAGGGVHLPFKDRATFLIDFIRLNANHIVASVEMEGDVRHGGGFGRKLVTPKFLIDSLVH